MCLLKPKECNRSKSTAYKVIHRKKSGLYSLYDIGGHFRMRIGRTYQAAPIKAHRTYIPYRPGFHAFERLRDATMFMLGTGIFDTAMARVTLRQVFIAGFDYVYCNAIDPIRVKCIVGKYQTIEKVYQPNEVEKLRARYELQ